jgi:Uma2 family endonuclease
VLIDTKQQAIDIYRRATENLWTLHIYGPGDIVELASIGMKIAIAELYMGVDFPGERDE